MDSYKKIIKIKPLVIEILRVNFESRDSDNLLILSVWDRQSNLEIKDYEVFRNLLINNKISTPASIIRCRCKLQEDNDELRGLLYEERKNQEKLTRNQLKLDF